MQPSLPLWSVMAARELSFPEETPGQIVERTDTKKADVDERYPVSASKLAAKAADTVRPAPKPPPPPVHW